VAAFVITANESGPNPDGGRGMALIFQIAFPFLILVAVSFLYWKTTSPALHIILLIVVTVPMVWLAARWMSGPFMDRDIAVGGYLYKDPKMKKFVAAIAKPDVQKVRELAPGIDVNEAGNLDVTPLIFAIQKVDEAGADPQTTAVRIDMVRLLLSLGAKPESALKEACGARHDEVTGLLLDAGANPNYKDQEGTPVFFYCGAGNAGGLTGLRLFAAKGADFNAPDAKGRGALIAAATFSQWDKMLFLLEHGVKDTATFNGKNAAAMVTRAIADDRQNSRETSPALKEVAAKLNR
jgi:hypothetical protein